MCKLRLSGIIEESIVDGPGIRFAIFVQGCSHNCPGCHNPSTHDYGGGYESDVSDVFNRIKNNHMISGVTFSGGEPFDQAETLAKLGEKVASIDLDILAYTGYTMEYILSKVDERPGFREVLMCCNTIIDGPFIMEKRSLDLRFRGSSNQRIIDVKKSLEKNMVVEKIL